GQHPCRRVTDEKKQRSTRRLLEDLEQRVGGIRIELVNGIDNADPPSIDGGRRAEKRNRLTRLVDRDDTSHHTSVVQAALKRQQAAVRACRYVMGNRIGWIDPERLGVLHVGGLRTAMRQYK